MRSLGLFSLLIVDHIPPSFSPCDVISALSLSFLSLACIVSKCSSSCARIASVAPRVSSVSKLGCCMTSCKSFFRFAIWFEVLWYDSRLWRFANVWISFLKLCHRVWGLEVSLSVCSRKVFSMFDWSFAPRSMTAVMSFLFCSEDMFQVHLPFPM